MFNFLRKGVQEDRWYDTGNWRYRVIESFDDYQLVQRQREQVNFRTKESRWIDDALKPSVVRK